MADKRSEVNEQQTTDAFVREVHENIAFARWLFSRMTDRTGDQLQHATARPRVSGSFGEIDVLAEFQADGGTITAHIEDKINARESGADQFDRYKKRKQHCQDLGQHVVTAIVAPSAYLDALTLKQRRCFDHHIQYQEMCRVVRDSALWKEGIQKHADGFIPSEYHTTWRSEYEAVVQQDGNLALRMCTPEAGFGGNKMTYVLIKDGLPPRSQLGVEHRVDRDKAVDPPNTICMKLQIVHEGRRDKIFGALTEKAKEEQWLRLEHQTESRMYVFVTDPVPAVDLNTPVSDQVEAIKECRDLVLKLKRWWRSVRDDVIVYR